MSDALNFLRWAQPGGPWTLTAIARDRKGIETRTLASEPEAQAFLDAHGAADLYWSPNPLLRPMQKKPTKGEVAEGKWLWVDLDPPKGEDPAAFRARVLAAKLPPGVPPPTCTVNSGRGIWLLWQLAKAETLGGDAALIAEYERYGEQLELLYTTLGADSCRNVDRIARLPGTVNRKTGEMACVVGEFGSDVSIAQFVKAPELPAATVKPAAVSVDPTKVQRVTNPATDPRLAEVPGWCKAAIVQGRDPDDPGRWRSRSEAQFAVSCQLVRSGVDDATHYAILTDPDLGIGEAVLKEKDGSARSDSHGYALKQIRDAHAERDREPPILDERNPLGSAREFLRRQALPHLMSHSETWLAHRGAAYAELEEDTLRAALYGFLECAKQRNQDPDKLPGPFLPNKTKVANAMEALRAMAHVPRDRHEPPCWLTGDGPPPGEIVACSNGLLHLPTGTLHELTPRFFTRNALEFAHDAGAAEPARWLRFLAEVWPDDAESVATLQEVFGYLLVPDTAQQKMFLLVGPPRSGKGTIARVLEGLVGKRNVCSPTMHSLGQPFGRESLLGKQLAIVADMKIGPKTDLAVVAETLLGISGEDSVDVPRKYRSAWHGRLAVRFLVMANEMPSIADASGALANRFVPLAMEQSFLGKEDPGLTAALLSELPGILRWAIEGWRRLRERGHFILPGRSRETVQAIARLASPVRAFVDEWCEVGPEESIAKAQLYVQWGAWCTIHGEHAGANSVFANRLKAVLPRIRDGRPRLEGEKGPPTWFGIGLSPNRGDEPF